MKTPVIDLKVGDRVKQNNAIYLIKGLKEETEKEITFFAYMEPGKVKHRDSFGSRVHKVEGMDSEITFRKSTSKITL